MTDTFDYIVIGGGAAGCVLANRLSEDPQSSVLLLEGGGRDWSPLLKIPAGFSKLMGTKVNWLFTTVPQQHMYDRTMFLPQGKVLGGSTSINAMLYIRGNRLDYEEWRDLGNKGWGFDDVLPYFKKSEDNQRFADEYHGVGGPLGVSDQIQRNPMSDVFVRAAQQAGIAFTADPNGASQDGVFYNQLTQRDARRESASTAFLKPVAQRKNLTVRTGAIVSKIVVHRGRAVGVEYTQHGRKRSVRAGSEILLSAGAINSPRLLLLSGIGDTAELRRVGIDPVHHLPGVGKNLHDQLEAFVTAEVTKPITYDGEDRWHRAIMHAIQYGLYRTGPATATVSEAGAFLRSDDDVRSPDIQLHMQPAFVVWSEGTSKIQRFPGHGVTLLACNTRPKSRGEVRLTSADPTVPPAVNPNYLADPEDVRIALEGFKWIRRILATPAFEPYLAREHTPGPDVSSDAEICEYIRRTGGTDYHPVGTCKMGTDESAVVDPELRVRGLGGLRVIDASIMPTIISGNTQAAAYMIGEKGADLVRGAHTV
jgi:choline dehydrogenase-like flavoprotein